MAIINDDVSIEDTSTQPKSKYLEGFKSWAGNKVESSIKSIGETAENIGGKVLEIKDDIIGTDFTEVIPSPKDIFNTIKNVGVGIQKGSFSDFDLFGEKTLNKPLQTTVSDATEEDRKLGNELNAIHGFDMGVDLLKGGWDYLDKKISGGELSGKIKNGIKEEQFYNEVNKFQTKIGEYNNKLVELENKPEYNNIITFNNNAVAEYLKLNNITEITDMNDFESFREEYLSKLNGVQQRNIIEQFQSYMKESSSLMQGLQSEEKIYKDYLSNNLDGGEETFNKSIEAEQKKAGDNKYLSIIGNIYSQTEQKVDTDIQALGLERISDFAGFNDLKDSIVDDAAVDRQYELSLLGMKDLPNNEELYKRMKEVNGVTYKFNIDFMKNYIDARNNPENSGLNEVDLRNKVLNTTWNTLPDSDKNLYAQKETLITSISQLRESSQFANRIGKPNVLDNLKAGLDIISYAGVTAQKIFDQAFSYTGEGVPHYVKQETRNLIMSDEGMGKKFVSLFTYNPDAIISTIASGRLLALPVKGLNQALKAAEKGVMKIPGLNVGFGKGTLQFFGKGSRAFTAGQLYSAGVDPIIDNVMVEAPTAGIETFNQVTSILFDVAPMSIGQGFKTGSNLGTKTMNSIVYNFLSSKDTKQAIDDFAKGIELKTGQKLSGGQSREVLENLVQPLYSSFYNPKEVESIFNTKGGLYKFITENVTKMEETGIKELLTEKGLGLSLNKGLSAVTGMPEKDILNIREAFVKKNTLEDGVQKQFAQAHFNKLKEFNASALEPDKGINGIQIDKQFLSNEEFVNLKGQANTKLELMSKASTQEEFDDALQEFNNIVREAQVKFASNLQVRNYIDVTDFVTGTNTRVYLDDDFSAKDMLDMVKDGTLQIKDKDGLKKYKVRGDKVDSIQTSFNQYLKENQKQIDEFVTKYTGIAGDSLSVDEVNKQIRNLLFGREGKTKDVTVVPFVKGLEFQDAKKILEDLGNIMTNTISGFLGKDSAGFDIMKKEPIYLNKVIGNKPDEPNFLSGEALSKYMSGDDSYMNISYGLYLDTSTKELTNAMYLTMGNKVQKNNIISESAAGENDKGKITISKLLNEHNEIKKILLSYGFKNGVFNIEEALEKLTILYSAGREQTDKLFTDGKLDKDKVTVYLIKETGIENTFVHNFVNELFKDAGEGYSILLEPMINSVAYAYAKSRHIIDEALKRQTTQEGFNEVFSGLLLSKNLIDDMSTILSKSTKVKESYKKHSKEILETLNKSWKTYKTNLKLKRSNIELNNSELTKWRDENQSLLSANNKLSDEAKDKILSRRNILDTEINKNNNIIKSIDAQLKKEKNPFEEVQLASYMKDLLRSKANSFSSLIQLRDEKLKDAINKLEINKGTLETIGETKNSIIKGVQSLTDAERKDINSFISLAKEGNQIKKMESIISGTTNEKIKGLMEEIFQLSNMSFKGKNIVFEDDIIKELDYVYNNKILLDYDEAIKKNPLSQYLSGFLNNNDLMQDAVFTRGILDYFSKLDGATTPYNLNSYELYNTSASFKDFIDSLTVKETIKGSFAKYELGGKLVGYQEMQSNYEKVIRDISNSVEVNAMKNGVDTNITKELVDKIVEDTKVRDRFVAISRLKDYNEIISKKIGYKITTRVLNYGTTKPQELSSYMNVLKDKSYDEQILQVDNMIDAGMNIGLIKNVDFGKFGYLDGGEEVKYVRNIANTINKHNEKYYANIKDIMKGRKLSELSVQEKKDVISNYVKINRRPSEALVRFSKIFNEGKSDYTFITGKGEEKQLDINKLITQSGLKDFYDGGFYFAGSFGDKDSLYTLYKAPQDLIEGLGIKGKANIRKLSESIYRVHYAYSNGYIKPDAPFNTFDEFKEFLLKNKGTLNDTIKLINDNVENISISIKDIKKREAFNMSNYSIAGNDKRKIDGLIVDIQVKNDVGLPKDLFDLSDIEFTSAINKYINDGGKYSEIVKSIIDADSNINKQKNGIAEVLYKDLTDGTAWSTMDIGADLLSYMGFGSPKYVKEELINKGVVREIKTHVYGEVDKDGKKVRYGGKHLVNIPNVIKDDKGNTLEMTYVTGIESAKLKGGAVLRTKDNVDDFKDVPNTIEIDGIEYKVIGKIPGMDMSFYKNAASTLIEEHTDMTISSSIQSVLSEKAAARTEELQLIEIDKAFEKLLAKINNPTLQLDAWSDIDKAVNKIVNEFTVGLGSSSILGGKLNEFMTRINQVIDKPKSEGQSVFIRQSSLDINPNEVIMSDKSPLVKQIREETRAKLYPDIESYDKLSVEEKLQVDGNLYTVGYRYPVPSKYNLGAYKILIGEELAKDKPNVFGEFGNMGNKQVVPHPIATYLKLQGDNDGDHIFFISMLSDWGDIIAKDILGKDLTSDLFKELKDGTYTIKNDFIIVDQVDKSSMIADPNATLLSSRTASLDAKSRIGVVSATGRTIKIVGQMGEVYEVNKSNGNVRLIRDGRNEEGKTNISSLTFNELQKELPNLKIDKSFYSYYDSLLQLTLDFGNSNASSFDELWFTKLISKLTSENIDETSISQIKTYAEWLMNDGKININGELKEVPENIVEISEDQLNTLFTVFKTMDEFITPMSTRYGNKLTTYKMDGIIRDKGVNLEKTDSDILKNYYYPIIGSKRNIYDKVMKKYGRTVAGLNKTDDVHFIISRMMENKNTFSNKYRKIMDEANQQGFLYKNVREFQYGEIKDDLSAYIKTVSNEERNIIKKFASIINKIKLSEDKQEKGLLRRELFTKENIEELNKYPVAKLGIVLQGYLAGDYKVINYLTNKEKTDYLRVTDESLRAKLAQLNNDEQTKAIIDKLGIDTTVGYTIADKQKYREYLDNTLNNLRETISNTKVDTIDDQIELDKNMIELDNIQTQIKELEDTPALNLADEVKNIEPTDYSNTNYILPNIKQEFVQLNYAETEKLLFDVASVAKKSSNLVSLRTSELLFKYVPDLLDVDSIIRDLMNKEISGKNIISDATAAHINHFADWTFFKNKKGINYLLKNSGIENYEQVGREVQYALLRYDNGLYTQKPINEAIESLKRILKTPEGDELLRNQDFIDAITDYSNTVIKPVTDTLTRIEAQTGYKVFNSYKGNTKSSLVNDVLKAHESDSQLALKIYGINSQKEFENLLKARGVKMTGTINTMINGLFKKSQDGVDKFIGFLKSIHYTMTYGVGSTFITQNGIMSGISQLLPNYAEVKSYYRANIDNMGEAYKSMKEYGLLDSENVMMFGTSIDKDLTDASNVNALITRVANNLGTKNVKGNPITSMAHMLITNPLAIGDLPVEEVRKLVAINQAMEQYGIKSFKDLNEKVLRHGNQFLGRFRTRVNMNFAESGGGVVSSSRIYRDTVFHHLDNYFDNIVMRMLNQTLGYLMGWSYHKAATLIEKEAAFVTGMRDIFRGDFKSGMMHIHDYIEFNSMLFRQAMYATGLYLKMNKFEKDNNDRVTFVEFQKAFNNSIVSMEVLLGRYKDGFEAAESQDASLGEQAKYTTFNMLKSAFRLFKQAEFVSTMYNHYQMKGLEGQADILDSFEYATNVHYTGYMRFQGITEAQDMYNTLISKGITGYLLLGGSTPEEDLFNKVITGNTFSSYKEKGFIGALLNHVNVFKNTGGNAGFNLTGEMAKEFRETLLRDEQIKKLVSGGQLGTGEGDYNIESLIGKPGTKMTDTQFENIKNLYYKISNYLYGVSGADQVVDDKYQSKYQTILNSSINEALKGEGITIDDFANYSNSPEDFLRVLSTLETKYNIPHPIALSILIDQEKDKLQSNLYTTRREQGLDTKLKDIDYRDLERTAMVKYQQYLNMNSDFVFQVIDSHASTYYSDVFDKYEKKFKDAGYAIDDAVTYVNNSYLIGKVISKDTSVSKLHSRYAIALKSLKPNDDTVTIVNGFLNGLFDLPYLSKKEKLANAAAALTGLNKATFKFLEEGSEEFNALTSDSKKLLANWMFKINKEAIDFDSSILANDVNRRASSGYSSALNRMLYPKYKSGSFGGARPNYSKQFEPIKQMLSNKLPYIERDYDGYLNSNNPYTKDKFVNPLNFPILRKYNSLLLQAVFRGYQSKGEIKNKSQVKVEEYNKRTLKMKKPKKLKTQERVITPRKRVLSHSKGLNPNLELGTQING